MIKRLFDFTASFFGLIIILPFFLIIALLVRVELGSPVFFTQVRPGKDGKPFRMIKFRTMTNERDEEGFLLQDKQRITKLGTFMRKSSLDELPELINVIQSDMSLVGPRPLLMKYLNYYNEYENQRHLVKPGITGLAQVKGRNNLSWEHKFRYDVFYVKRMNLVFDLKILLLTIKKVLSRSDVKMYADQGSLSNYRKKIKDGSSKA